MANKKISELQSRTPALSDLMLVGDPSSGYSYKCTVTALATIIETDIADGYVTIGTTQTISGAKTFSNNLTLTSVVNTPTDPDKFLTLNASNVVTYRTGAEVLSDIGGVGGSGTTNYLPKFSATTTLANSQIFDNGTNIGIATATPDATARVQINKTDGYGLYLNYNTSTGSGVTTTALYAINTTASSGYAAVIEEKTPNTTAGQYPFVIKHSLSSGTAGVGFGTGVHFQLLDDAGTSKTTQLTIENIDAAAATYKTRYRFNVQNNGSSTPVVYINGTGLGVFTASPSVALDVTGEGKFSTINNATTDTDKFLVSDSGVLKYRTGTQILSDIGAADDTLVVHLAGTEVITGVKTFSSQPVFNSGISIPNGNSIIFNGTSTLISGNASSNELVFTTGNTLRATINNSGLTLNTLSAATIDTDRFLVSDSGVIKYRTGAEVLSDIGAASSSSISGTTNYIPKFTSSSAIGNSVIYESGGSIGINTISPNATLEVNGSFNSTDGTSTVRIINSGGLGLFGTVGSHPLVFRTVNTERMRLDASGNLGLGTSAPSGSGWDESSTVLHIYKNAINGGLLKLESSNTTAILNAGNDQLAIFTTTNDPIRFGTNGSERMRLDTSGNLGLGVTPSAWDRPAYQSTQNLALLGLSNTSNLAQNAYYNAGWKYITTAAAADFQVAQGAFYWFNAPSGTAGNAISFTQAMTLDASGNLLLGGTTGNDRLVINDSKSSTSQYTSTGFVTISNSDQTNNNWSTIAFTDGPTQAFSTAIQTKYTDHTNNYGELHFSTRSSAGLTTKLMIAEGGNVGINNTTPSYKLTIQANGATESALGFIDVNTNGRTWLIGPGVGTGSSADFGFYNNTASQLASLFTTGTSAKWAWYTGGSERMRLDASGNLGLGNSAPSYKFDILGSSTNGIGQIIKNSNSNSYFTIDVYGTNGFGVTNWPYSAVLESVPQSTGGLVLSAYSNGIYFQTGARQTRMTLDASGNLGLGVTPSAWTGTGVKAFQFQNGSLAASSSFGTWLSWNAYYDGSDKYVSSSTAGRYLIEGNVHRWDIAPSGTAGNAISFTQAMTLFSTGNLSVGGTSDTGEKLQITGRAVINANSGALNADILTVRGGGSSGNYGFKVEANNGADLFYTDNYTYNVIMGTTGGLVGIGTTSPTSKLHIVATSSNNALRLDSDVSGTYTILEFANAGTTKSQIYNDLSGGDMVMRTTTSANLIFGTNSSERMRITSGGNVGIGTSSPAVKLDVIEGGTPAAASAGTVARFVTAGGSGYDALIGIVGGTGGRSMIDLGDTGSSSIGRLGYDHTADFMFFQTNGSERMRIASDGNVGIGGNVGAPDAKLTISNNSAEGIEFAVALFSNLNRILSYNRNTSVYNTLRFDGLDNQFYTQGIEKMRLTSSGELLINTTSDAGDYKLQVNGNVYATGIGYINGGVVGNSSNNLYLSSNSSGGEISFWANQLNTRLMTILGGGDVGIGVSSPSAKLEVNGAIKTAAPSGGTAKPWKLGEAGVTLGGSNTSGVRVEIDGVVYYLVTGYLP